MPLVFVLGIAGISLVSLQKGYLEGIWVALIAAAILLGLGLLVGSNGKSIALLLGVSWLPVIIISSRIKNHGNIVYGLQLGFVFAVLLLGILYGISMPESDKYWSDFFTNNLEPVLLQLGMNQAVYDDIKNILIFNMNGLLASSIVLLVVLGLLIGRYWQAKLYNPGGFGKEFRELKFGKSLAIFGLVAFILSMLGQDFRFFADLKHSFIMLFLLQGLAIAHYLVEVRGFGQWALLFVYAGLFILPILSFVLAVISILDNWFDFRSNLSS